MRIRFIGALQGLPASVDYLFMLAPVRKRQKPCPAHCFQNAEQGSSAKEKISVKK
jgi:hypothetical protein